MSEARNPAAPQPRRLRLRLGILLYVATGILTVVWLWLAFLRFTAPRPPDVDLSGVEPMVVEAIGAARERVIARPRTGTAWGELGMVLHAHGFHEQADSCYEQAEKFDRDNPAWPYLAGATRSAPDERAEDFRRALRASSAAPAVRLALAEALVELDQIDEAESLFARALEDDAGEGRAYLGLARVAMARGQAEAAIPHIQKCIARAGDLRAAYTLLAEAYHRVGDTDMAEAARRRAGAPREPHFWADPYLEQVALRQTGITGLGRRATALYRAGRGEEALALLEELVRRYPESGPAVGGLGRMNVLLGRFAQGEPFLRQALEMDPDLVEVRNYLGIALKQQAKCAEAIAEFQAVIERQPDHGDAYLRIGQCQYFLGDKAGAARALEEAVRYKPDDLMVQKNLGAVLFELGRYPEAVKRLEQAKALAPEDRGIQTLLARARASSGGG